MYSRIGPLARAAGVIDCHLSTRNERIVASALATDASSWPPLASPCRHRRDSRR